MRELTSYLLPSRRFLVIGAAQPHFALQPRPHAGRQRTLTRLQSVNDVVDVGLPDLLLPLALRLAHDPSRPELNRMVHQARIRQGLWMFVRGRLASARLIGFARDGHYRFVLRIVESISRDAVINAPNRRGV